MKEFSKGVIYKFTNLINGKLYIGKTQHKDPIKYCEGHYNYALKTNDNKYFHRAIRKYGKENFKYEFICEVYNLNDLNNAEIFYIAYYRNKLGIRNLYNIAHGGQGGGGLHINPNKQAILAKMKIVHNKPEVRQRHVLAGLRRESNPHYKEKFNKIIRLSHSTPKARENHKKANLKLAKEMSPDLIRVKLYKSAEKLKLSKTKLLEKQILNIMCCRYTATIKDLKDELFDLYSPTDIQWVLYRFLKIGLIKKTKKLIYHENKKQRIMQSVCELVALPVPIEYFYVEKGNVQ